MIRDVVETLKTRIKVSLVSALGASKHELSKITSSAESFFAFFDGAHPNGSAYRCVGPQYPIEWPVLRQAIAIATDWIAAGRVAGLSHLR